MMLFFCITSTMQNEIRPKESATELDDALIAAVASGDREAFACLYRLTDKAVYGYLLSILKNHHEAEDCMQDTYLKIDAGAKDYQPQGKPMAWVLTIARNQALMRLRHRRNAPTELTDDVADTQVFSLPDAVCRQEDRMVLQTVLQVLDEQERQIVMLHVTAGLKHREIAGMLGIPLPTALSKYRRALAKLKRALEQAEGGDVV